MGTTNTTPQGAQPKCTVCSKPLAAPPNNASSNASADTICDECKQKKKRKKMLIGALLLGTALIGAGSWYYLSDRAIRSAEGFGGVATIDDSIKVKVQNTDKLALNIASATLASSPASAQAPISNIEDFNSTIFENARKAKDKGENTLTVPTSTLQFLLNSQDLSDASNHMIEGLAKFFKQTNQQASIVVEGFTCNLGDKDVNNTLSQQRAEAVKEALVNLGIDPSKIKVKWYGKSRNKEFHLADQADYRRVLVSFQ